MIAAIENAIVDRVEAASAGGVLGYRLKTVATYSGEFDGDINQVVKAYPAVWATFGGYGRPRRIGAEAWQYKATFSVVSAAKSARNEAASRHGAAGAEVGSYQILQDVRGLLVGQTLALNITSMTPGRAFPLVNGLTQGKKLSVMVQEFDTEFAADEGTDVDTLADFTTFHVDWDVPPLGNVIPPLPAAAPDAQDTVTLETV